MVGTAAAGRRLDLVACYPSANVNTPMTRPAHPNAEYWLDLTARQIVLFFIKGSRNWELIEDHGDEIAEKDPDAMLSYLDAWVVDALSLKMGAYADLDGPGVKLMVEAIWEERHEGGRGRGSDSRMAPGIEEAFSIVPDIDAVERGVVRGVLAWFNHPELPPEYREMLHEVFDRLDEWDRLELGFERSLRMEVGLRVVMLLLYRKPRALLRPPVAIAQEPPKAFANMLAEFLELNGTVKNLSKVFFNLDRVQQVWKNWLKPRGAGGKGAEDKQAAQDGDEFRKKQAAQDSAKFRKTVWDTINRLVTLELRQQSKMTLTWRDMVMGANPLGKLPETPKDTYVAAAWAYFWRFIVLRSVYLSSNEEANRRALVDCVDYRLKTMRARGEQPLLDNLEDIGYSWLDDLRREAAPDQWDVARLLHTEACVVLMQFLYHRPFDPDDYPAPRAPHSSGESLQAQR